MYHASGSHSYSDLLYKAQKEVVEELAEELGEEEKEEEQEGDKGGKQSQNRYMVSGSLCPVPNY